MRLSRENKPLHSCPTPDVAKVGLEGPAGAGKTALLDWTAREAERGGRTVLRGAARPTERVPFNAMDGVVDDLARWLARHRGADPEGLIAKAKAAASSAFPVLGPNAREAARERLRARMFGGAAPHAAPSRKAVFEALGRLLRYVATDEGVVVTIDDLQWADEDSTALLDHLIESEDARRTIVVAMRDEIDQGPRTRWVQRGDAHRIHVPPLGNGAYSRHFYT